MSSPVVSLFVEGGRLKIANLVTLLRGLLIAPVLALLVFHQPRWALGIYLLACATDLIDGWLARLTGQASAFGAQLDAAIDNVFSLAILPCLLLAAPHVVAAQWPATVVLFGAPLIYLPVSMALTGRVMMFHVWSAKVGAFLLFILWPLIALTGWSWWVVVAAAVVGLSRAEQVFFIFRGGSDLDAPHGFVPVSPQSKALIHE